MKAIHYLNNRLKIVEAKIDALDTSINKALDDEKQNECIELAKSKGVLMAELNYINEALEEIS